MSRNIPKSDKEVLAASIYRPISCSPGSTFTIWHQDKISSKQGHSAPQHISPFVIFLEEVININTMWWELESLECGMGAALLCHWSGGWVRLTCGCNDICPPQPFLPSTPTNKQQRQNMNQIKEIKCGKLRCIEQQFPSIYIDRAAAVCITPGDMGSRVSLGLFSVI